MPVMMHRHKEMAGEHGQYENEKSYITVQTQGRCGEDQQEGQSASYQHIDPVFQHDINRNEI
jgi:hypothetical protein